LLAGYSSASEVMSAFTAACVVGVKFWYATSAVSMWPVAHHADAGALATAAATRARIPARFAQQLRTRRKFDNVAERKRSEIGK
jgi:hypothetical protein